MIEELTKLIEIALVYETVSAHVLVSHVYLDVFSTIAQALAFTLMFDPEKVKQSFILSTSHIHCTTTSNRIHKRSGHKAKTSTHHRPASEWPAQ